MLQKHQYKYQRQQQQQKQQKHPNKTTSKQLGFELIVISLVSTIYSFKVPMSTCITQVVSFGPCIDPFVRFLKILVFESSCLTISPEGP